MKYKELEKNKKLAIYTVIFSNRIKSGWNNIKILKNPEKIHIVKIR